MTVTVFGATGTVGEQLVTHALAKGWHVKAFGRNIEKWIDKDLDSDNFTAIKGYVFDAGEILHALRGSDAVLAALGSSFDTTDKSRSLGMKNIVTQMQKAGVRRIVALGAEGILPAADGNFLMDLEDYPSELVPVGEEHKQAYTYLLESSLDWTFVCPPAIFDKDADANFETATEAVTGGSRVSSGNVAVFMVNEVDLNQHISQRVGISDR